MSRDERQEASIVANGRISAVDLAQLDTYFERKGYRIRTMSQLLSWGIGYLVEQLKNNGADMQEFESLAAAYDYLSAKGLCQQSMRERGYKKMGTAIRFENLRKEGYDPKTEAPTQYNMLHNQNSVKPFGDNVRPTESDLDIVARALEAQGIKTDKLEEWQIKRLQTQMESGIRPFPSEAAKKAVSEAIATNAVSVVSVKEGMTEEEFIERQRKMNKAITDAENAPLDMDFLRSQVVPEPDGSNNK